MMIEPGRLSLRLTWMSHRLSVCHSEFQPFEQYSTASVPVPSDSGSDRFLPVSSLRLSRAQPEAGSAVPGG
eukprot:1187278-Rhodomonas_salina.1